MAVLFIIFSLYIFWGPIALIAANFIVAKQISTLTFQNGALLVLAELLIFTPTLVREHSYFPDLFLPWHISYVFSPPKPEFSLLGLIGTLALSTVSLIAWYFLVFRTNRS
ncbi:MAG: hypothetical protein JNJ49_15030 [Bdellovibrionaceae bacterium]|nr:hypothetical protein [Pseudobdellovibrionaceae bacterium]